MFNSPLNDQHATQQFHITNLVLTMTGTYNDVVSRPYTTNFDGAQLGAIQEATHGGRMLEQTNLAGVAGSIIRPLTEPQGIIPIANGWDTKRFRFFMRVEHPHGIVQYLTGYTDDADVSYANTLNPNMRLYFNNSIMTRPLTVATSFGAQTQYAVSDASHILSGEFNPTFGRINETTHTMRPEDLLKHVGTTSMLGNVIDTRTSFAQNKLKKSRRSNGAPTSYLSRVLQAHANSVISADAAEDSHQKILNRAAGSVREGLITHDLFLAAAQYQTSLTEGSSLTYRELCGMSPGLDDRADVVFPQTLKSFDGHGDMPSHIRGSTAYWTETTNEALFCTILSQSIPGIMTDLMIQKIGFMATNRTVHGGIEIKITNILSFADIDLGPFIDTFLARLEYEVLRDLTQNNQIDMNLMVFYDLMGESRFDITLFNGPETTFVTPSFSDALFTPVITNSADTFQKMAFDIDSIMDNISVDHSVQNTSYKTAPNMQGYNSNGHFSTI